MDYNNKLYVILFPLLFIFWVFFLSDIAYSSYRLRTFISSHLHPCDLCSFPQIDIWWYFFQKSPCSNVSKSALIWNISLLACMLIMHGILVYLPRVPRLIHLKTPLPRDICLVSHLFFRTNSSLVRKHYRIFIDKRPTANLSWDLPHIADISVFTASHINDFPL